MMPVEPAKMPAMMKSGTKIAELDLEVPMLASAAHPAARGQLLVHPAVDLFLDPVEEALDQMLVVRRAELLPRGERRFQLLLGLRLHVRGLSHTGLERI